VDPDRNNWGPRIGLAYNFARKWVVRSGYGINYVHYDRAGGGNLLPINGPQVITAVVSQTFLLPNGTLNPNFRTTQQGYPAGLTDPSQFDPLKANITYVPRDYKAGYVMNWFLAVQREVARNTVVEIAYVGNRANRLLLFGNFNQAVPNQPGQNLTLQQRRPIAAFGDITYAFNGAFSDYNSLEVRFERRMSSGWQVLNSFTWSKAIDNAAGSLENPNGNFPGPGDINNRKADKGLSAYDQPFTNITSFIWDLPVGRGRKHFSSWPGVADAFLSGWSFSGINTMTSGPVVTLTYNPAAAFVVSGISADFRGANNYRVNVLGDPKVPESLRTVGFYLDPTKVKKPTDVGPSPFGNAGRNTVRADGLFQLDFAIAKNFRLPFEGASLQFRAEAFNLFNKTNLRAPDGNLSNTTFGKITSANDSRQLQLGLKFAF